MSGNNVRHHDLPALREKIKQAMQEELKGAMFFEQTAAQWEVCGITENSLTPSILRGFRIGMLVLELVREQSRTMEEHAELACVDPVQIMADLIAETVEQNSHAPRRAMSRAMQDFARAYAVLTVLQTLSDQVSMADHNMAADVTSDGVDFAVRMQRKYEEARLHNEIYGDSE